MAKVIVLLRLDEATASVLPSDEAGSLNDLNVDTGITLPTVVDGLTGRGRLFADGVALDGTDVVSGSSLATRDVSIQAIVSWDFTTQNTYGQPGTIVARGKGNAAAEYVSYALELRVVNATLGIGELRFWWQDTAGVVHTEIGGHFAVPPPGGFVMLTATRHWVSSSEVHLRYYVGDQLLADIVSTDGDIAGGTTGTFCLGTRYSAGTPGRFFQGIIDELRVLDYELSAEEVAATWTRISQMQPAGYKAIRDLLPPGAPLSDDVKSRVQKIFRIAGHSLGYATAQIANARLNLLPDRAYGDTLEQWERILLEAPGALDSIDQRRARIVGHMRRHAGVSIPGVNAALDALLGLTAAQVQVLAYTPDIVDPFDTLDPLRWWSDPSADWTLSGGALRVQAIAGDFTQYATFKRNLTSIGGDGRGAHILAKLTPTTVPDGAGAGVIFCDNVHRNAVALVLSRSGTHYFVNAVTYAAGVAVANPWSVDLGVGLPANIWLHLAQSGAFGFGGASTMGPFTPSYSLTGPTSGFVTGAAFQHYQANQWAGHLFLGFNATAGASDFRFDDTTIRAPSGNRPFHFYVYRDPALPGSFDRIGSNNVLRALKHAHTWAAVITSKQLVCDDPTTPCDGGPCGG